MKKIATLIICTMFLLGACGIMVNNNRIPSNMSDRAVNEAVNKKLIQQNDLYLLGDAGFGMLPILVGFSVISAPVIALGILGGVAVGLTTGIMDINNKANYEIVDQKLFDAWYKNYQKTEEGKNILLCHGHSGKC